MNINANITVSVPAIEKLVDYLASGFGAVGGAMLASRRAQNEAQARRIAALGEADAQRILTAANTERLRAYAITQAEARKLLVSPDSSVQGELDISDMINSRIRFQEQKRHRNIEAVVGQAALEVGDKEVQDREPDHDWTARFFTDVQDVSSQEMQLLWSKVLAGEVERPGSTSVRSLSVLKNMDKKASRLFVTLCSLCVFVRLDDGTIHDARVPSLGQDPTQNSLSDYGLGFGALNVLNEHGLIITDYKSWNSFDVYNDHRNDATSAHLVFQGTTWDLSMADQNATTRNIQMSGVALTRAGIELSGVVQIVESKNFALELIKFFHKQGINMVVDP